MFYLLYIVWTFNNKIYIKVIPNLIIRKKMKKINTKYGGK